jgi:hypothetical protein
MNDSKKARTQLQRFYALTHQLTVALETLDGAVPGVRVEIREADGDIEGLVFTVLMEGARSSREDLRAVMDQLKAVTAQKAKVREALEQRPDRGGLDLLSVSSLLSAVIIRSELDLVVDEMKHDLDSMSELGEMESLRLQMAMDRLSKMMSTLSNLLKKLSCTASQITQNMK